MQRILSKRVLRDIRENLLRYLALFFLVALVMYMVVAIVGAAETIMQGTKESGRVHHIEDGQFGVFVPLTEKETAQITEKGVTLQRDFSLDFHLGQSTFRVYQARETFRAKMAIRYYNPEKLENKILHWELKQQKKIIREGSVVIPDGAFDLVELCR